MLLWPLNPSLLAVGAVSRDCGGQARAELAAFKNISAAGRQFACAHCRWRVSIAAQAAALPLRCAPAEGLWIGPRKAARSPALLARLSITHIVAANGDSCSLAESVGGLRCLSLPWDDEPSQPLEPWLSHAVLFVLGALEPALVAAGPSALDAAPAGPGAAVARLVRAAPTRPARVLVHCTAGVSRSASVCVAAMLARWLLRWVSAGGAPGTEGASRSVWEPVLEHCGASALEAEERCPVATASAALRLARPWVLPNKGFRSQLRAWSDGLAQAACLAAPPGEAGTKARLSAITGHLQAAAAPVVDRRDAAAPEHRPAKL